MVRRAVAPACVFRPRRFRQRFPDPYRPASPLLGMPSPSGTPTMVYKAPGTGYHQNNRTGLPLRVDRRERPHSRLTRSSRTLTRNVRGASLAPRPTARWWRKAW